MSLQLYYRWRSSLKTGDLLLWRSYTFLGWLIRLFGPTNHAGLLIKLDKFEGLLHRRWTLEYLGHGGVLNLLSDRLKDYKGQLFWHPLNPEFEDRRNHVAGWAFLNKGREYDYGSLFKLAFSRVSANAQSFVCSEYVYFAMLSAGIVKKQQKIPYPWDLPALGCWEDGVKIYDSTAIQGGKQDEISVT